MATLHLNNGTSGLIMSAANQRQQCQKCFGRDTKNARQIGWNDTEGTWTNDCISAAATLLIKTLEKD